MYGASLVAQTVKSLPEMQIPWVRKIPWRKVRLPTPVFLSGEFHGQRSLVGYNPWGHKESDTIEWLTLWASQVALVVKNQPANAGDIWDIGSTPGSGRSSGGECGNPLQYSCLENPVDGEPGGLESIGSQRVGHKWSNLVHMHKQCI